MPTVVRKRKLDTFEVNISWTYDGRVTSAGGRYKARDLDGAMTKFEDDESVNIPDVEDKSKITQVTIDVRKVA
jgi:hypothetical protein